MKRGNCGRNEASVALTGQARANSKSGLLGLLGLLPTVTMQAIDRALRITLDL